MVTHQTVELLNTMLSDTFEIFHVGDLVDESNTLYHHHDFYEIHCTLKGSGTFFMDGREFALTAGTIVLIPPNSLHRILNQTSDYFERCYLFIHPGFLHSLSTKSSQLETCFQQGGKPHSRLLQMNPATLGRLLQAFEEPIKQEDFGQDLEYQYRLVRFLIALNRMTRQEGDIAFEQISNSPNERIIQAMDYVKTHLAEDLSLEIVAKKLYISHYYLSRTFKKETAMTFHTYVLKKRLLYSKELLRQQRTANQIYSLCGFRSYTHFLRCFKKEFSMTPKEFLKQEASRQLVQFDHYENLYTQKVENLLNAQLPKNS